MATTIRLTRMGRKQAPFYRIVVCDSRIRRDGDYIESLGFYNPIPDAYQLSVDHDKAVHWLSQGAQPTDTAKSLLRNEGVMLRWHLTRSGAPAEEIDSKVEAFRTRRATEHESIRAKTKADQQAWIQAKEKAAADKLKKAAASAEAATEEAAAEAEGAEETASGETTES